MGDFVDLWVTEFVDLWVANFVDLWVAEFVDLWVVEFVNLLMADLYEIHNNYSDPSIFPLAFFFLSNIDKTGLIFLN